MRHSAWLSRKLSNKKIECLACNHRCQITPGKTGICGVRLNEDGELKLLVYGRAAAVNVDPIEKKPLFHFYPGTEIFSIGTVGCNFHCLFCQNHDISQFHKEYSISEIEKAGQDLLPEKIVEHCLANKIPAIAYTYNEPAIFFEYAYDTAKLAHEKGLKNVYVSNGFETREALAKIQPYLDAVNIDLKSWRNGFYSKICGGRVEPVKENIRWLWENNIWLEITTLIIPRQNDSVKELAEISEFINSVSPDLPWHISCYFPCYQMSNPPTPVETLEQAYEIGKKAGLKYVYVGNAPELRKEDTFCPECGETVIKRLAYSTENKLNKDECSKCRCKIVGRF